MVTTAEMIKYERHVLSEAIAATQDSLSILKVTVERRIYDPVIDAALAKVEQECTELRSCWERLEKLN